MGEYLTPEQIAEQLAVTPSTVRRWIRSGALPAVKAGPRVWRISKADLDEYLQRARNRK